MGRGREEVLSPAVLADLLAAYSAARKRLSAPLKGLATRTIA
jgi:hypothetical protein